MLNGDRRQFTGSSGIGMHTGLLVTCLKRWAARGNFFDATIKIDLRHMDHFVGGARPATNRHNSSGPGARC
jgi:hypothetical protein